MFCGNRRSLVRSHSLAPGSATGLWPALMSSAPSLQAASAESELRRLLDIMAALRDPDRGCPWDRQQSFDTIAPYTVEEAYEVADAIARRDLASLPDELG